MWPCDVNRWVTTSPHQAAMRHEGTSRPLSITENRSG